jgi:hypothetical protein
MNQAQPASAQPCSLSLIRSSQEYFELYMGGWRTRPDREGLRDG